MVAHWLAHGAEVRPGVPAERINAFEERFGVQLPDDLRAYFGLCDGAEWPGRDPDHMRSLTEFWPLDRVQPACSRADEDPWELPDGLGASDSYFVAADYLISSAVFSIRLTPDPDAGNPMVIGPYSRAYGVIPLATSFTEFVELYLDRPEALQPR